MGKKKTSSSNKVSVVALRRNAALGYKEGREGFNRRRDWMGRNVWLSTDHFNALIEANPLDEQGLAQTIKRYNRAIMRSSLAGKEDFLLRPWTGPLDVEQESELDLAAGSAAALLANELNSTEDDLAGAYGDLHIIMSTLDRWREERESGP